MTLTLDGFQAPETVSDGRTALPVYTSVEGEIPLIVLHELPGMTDKQRHDAAERAATLPPPCAKGYRYESDGICRKSHIRAIEATFGTAFELHPLLPGRGHSTVTGTSPNEEVFRDIVDFLKPRLSEPKSS